MTKYYISPIKVEESINYFKNLHISKNDMLMMYLITKHFGVSQRRRVTIAAGEMDSYQKSDMLQTLWIMGGLFDNLEEAEKNSVLFPTSFSDEKVKSTEMFQSGTIFRSLASRPRDTIKQKNTVTSIFSYHNTYVLLRRNYKELISNTYLHDNKISLKHFTSWIIRFIGFDFKSPPSDIEFTRVVTKWATAFLKVTKTDFLWLFDDDVLNNSFSPVEFGITGETLRSLFDFEEGTIPEIIAKSGSDNPSLINDEVGNETVETYLQITGENPTDSHIKETLFMKKQIVLTGVPGVGKSRFLSKLKEEFHRSEIIQFHENYSYEDFIGGQTLSQGNIQTKKGLFLDFIEDAKKVENSDKNFLFIIDELNRGNISQIFGETILALDRGYHVTLSKEIDGISVFSIPDNVYIAASMNTSDRNITFLDLAIRRRFAFIDFKPNYEILSAITEYDSYDLGNVLKKINQEIINTLAKDELLLGHSYFLTDDILENDRYIWTDEKMQLQFNFVILPTLKEYTFSNMNALTTILGSDLSTCLLDLNAFNEAFEFHFGEQ